MVNGNGPWIHPFSPRYCHFNYSENCISPILKVMKILANFDRSQPVNGNGPWVHPRRFPPAGAKTFPWPCPLPLIGTHSHRNFDQNSDLNWSSNSDQLRDSINQPFSGIWQITMFLFRQQPRDASEWAGCGRHHGGHARGHSTQWPQETAQEQASDCVFAFNFYIMG